MTTPSADRSNTTNDDW